MTRPSFSEESLLWSQGYDYVAGIDEVGRGCFAGPLVAAAVIFDKVSPCQARAGSLLAQINDSKLLSAKKREQLSVFIKEEAIYHAIVEVGLPYINRYGIGKAGERAFKDLVNQLSVLSFQFSDTGSSVVSLLDNQTERLKTGKLTSDNGKQRTDNRSTELFFLTDAFPIKGLSKKRQKSIIKGDQKSISIAAASIIAKVYRDKLMGELPKKYLHFGFAKHKGYGTKEHREAIKQFGLSDLHRTSFKLEKFL
jgi:ribonuclease HII